MDMEKLLAQCGFSKRYQGYYSLQECIRIALEDEENLQYITFLYYKAGRKLHISWSSVERNIRTIINISWKNGGKEQLEDLAGRTFDKKPTVGEVIEMLTCYMKDHCNDF